MASAGFYIQWLIQVIARETTLKYGPLTKPQIILGFRTACPEPVLAFLTFDYALQHPRKLFRLTAQIYLKVSRDVMKVTSARLADKAVSTLLHSELMQ